MKNSLEPLIDYRMHQQFRQNQLHSRDADSFIIDSTDNQRDSRVPSRVDLVDTS